MTQPSVTLTELDGALGVLSPSAGLLAIVGASSKGPVDTPATYARVSDLVADFGSGPGIEAAAEAIKAGKPVVFVRTGQTTEGTATALDDAGVTGTSVVTRDSAVDPIDDYEFRFEVITGGTIGVAGITFRWSLDDGRTWSPTTALGVANTWTAPADATPTGSAAPGVKLNFAAGTLVAGDFVTCRTSAPQANATELGDALDALAGSILTWELCHVVGPLDGSLFDVVAAAFASMAAAGKEHAFVAHTRVPDIGESEATYKSALDTIFSAKASVHGALCAGACKLTSGVTRRKYKRPISFPVAARESALSEEVNAARIDLGSLIGLSIRDANGNADEHDESLNPGLDDSRFYVLRTWQGRAGVYVNRPRIFSAEGSDFRLVPHRRVINIGKRTVRSYLELRCNKEIRVDATTGFILEEDALEIEVGANALLAGALLGKPKASAAIFTLNRNDNILSTMTLRGQARITPLAYPEFIEVEIGFTNPALQVQTV